MTALLSGLALAAPIHEFASQGDLAKLKDCLEVRKVKVELADEEGRTALHQAAAGNHVEAVRYLISRKANVNARDKEGLTPLTVAVWNCNLEMVDLLLGAGSDIHTKDKSGNTLLSSLAFSPKGKRAVPVMQLLVKRGANPKTLNEGFNLLHEACLNSAIPQANYLVKTLKFDVNAPAKNRLGNRPLHCAFDFQMVAWLLDAGADINALNLDGETVLQNSALLGDLERVKFLLAKKAKVNTRDVLGRSPLSSAAASQNLDVIKALLEAGADVQLGALEGCSPLFAAISSQETSVSILQYLIERGASPKVKDTKGCSLLHEAATYGALKPALYLIETQGLNVNESNGQKVYPIHLCMLHPEVARALLSKGAQVNVVSEGGETALMWSSQYGKVDTIKALLEAGADRTLKNGDGKTALDLANERLKASLGSQAEAETLAEDRAIVKLLSAP